MGVPTDASAESALRTKWVEQSKDARSPDNVDFLTWTPIERWKAPASARRIRHAKAERGFTWNPHYRGRHHADEREISSALIDVKRALPVDALPFLLAAILIERHVERHRVHQFLVSRFGRTPAAKPLATGMRCVRALIDRELEARLGFLPRYQLRWIGAV